MKPVDYQKRFAHVECWHVVTKTGVMHVGSPERLLIVEANAALRPVLGGRAGVRFSKLLGYDRRADLLDDVDHVNLTVGALKRVRFEAAGVLFLGRFKKAEGRQLCFPALMNSWWSNKDNVERARYALEPFAGFARTGRWPQ